MDLEFATTRPRVSEIQPVKLLDRRQQIRGYSPIAERRAQGFDVLLDKLMSLFANQRRLLCCKIWATSEDAQRIDDILTTDNPLLQFNCLFRSESHALVGILNWFVVHR